MSGASNYIYTRRTLLDSTQISIPAGGKAISSAAARSEYIHIYAYYIYSAPIYICMHNILPTASCI